MPSALRELTTFLLGKQLLADVRPLQESPEYRRLWIAGSLSSLGSQMTSVAVPVQIYTLTHSTLAVGFAGVPQALPLITLGLLGGTVADAVDRRILVIVTGILQASVSLALAAQAALNVGQLWLLYVLIALQSSLNAIEQPARRSFIRNLLPQARIRAASALGFLSFQISLVAGPLLAGVIIAVANFRMVYLVDAVTFVVALYAVVRLHSLSRQTESTALGLRAVIEGLRFVRYHPILAPLLLADLNATIFGMPRALFPAISVAHFGGLHSVGLLYAAPAIGGILSAGFSGPLGHVRRQGLVVLVSIGIWGASIAAFGLSRLLWVAVMLLAIAGAADVVNGVFRTTILQVVTPDRLQGRVNSLGFVVGVGGPELGDVEAGMVAALSSPSISAFIGGLASVVGVLVIGLTIPSFARFRSERTVEGE